MALHTCLGRVVTPTPLLLANARRELPWNVCQSCTAPFWLSKSTISGA
jgi:hypothetical protein